MKVERKQLIEVDLRSTQVALWPHEARELASLILTRPGGGGRSESSAICSRRTSWPQWSRQKLKAVITWRMSMRKLVEVAASLVLWALIGVLLAWRG